MRWRKLTPRSIIVAVIVGFSAPVIWFVIAGETQRTPVVEKRMTEKKTQAEREEWKRANFQKVGFWEHVRSIPHFIALFWWEYLIGSAVVFMIVLVVNGAILTGRKNEP